MYSNNKQLGYMKQTCIANIMKESKFLVRYYKLFALFHQYK